MPRKTTNSRAPALKRAEQWFSQRGWEVFDFQRAVWQAAASGQSGLLHSGTGSGKTYAVWFGALLHAEPRLGMPDLPANAPGLRVLWITPMRALAADTLRALQAPLADLLPDVEVKVLPGIDHFALPKQFGFIDAALEFLDCVPSW